MYCGMAYFNFGRPGSPLLRDQQPRSLRTADPVNNKIQHRESAANNINIKTLWPELMKISLYRKINASDKHVQTVAAIPYVLSEHSLRHQDFFLLSGLLGAKAVVKKKTVQTKQGRLDGERLPRSKTASREPEEMNTCAGTA